jgi:hypothetical protein
MANQVNAKIVVSKVEYTSVSGGVLEASQNEKNHPAGVMISIITFRRSLS